MERHPSVWSIYVTKICDRLTATLYGKAEMMNSTRLSCHQSEWNRLVSADTLAYTYIYHNHIYILIHVINIVYINGSHVDSGKRSCCYDSNPWWNNLPWFQYTNESAARYEKGNSKIKAVNNTCTMWIFRGTLIIGIRYTRGAITWCFWSA